MEPETVSNETPSGTFVPFVVDEFKSFNHEGHKGPRRKSKPNN